MDVPHHSDRCLDMHDVALLHEQLFGFGTDGLDDRLGQELLAVEPLDAFVQVDGGCKECQLLYRGMEVGQGHKHGWLRYK